MAPSASGPRIRTSRAAPMTFCPQQLTSQNSRHTAMNHRRSERKKSAAERPERHDANRPNAVRAEPVEQDMRPVRRSEGQREQRSSPPPPETGHSRDDSDGTEGVRVRRVSTDEEVDVGEHPKEGEADDPVVSEGVTGQAASPRKAGEPGAAAFSNEETDGDTCQRVTDGAGHSAEYNARHPLEEKPSRLHPSGGSSGDPAVDTLLG